MVLSASAGGTICFAQGISVQASDFVEMLNDVKNLLSK
jgi:hypothetical protein